MPTVDFAPNVTVTRHWMAVLRYPGPTRFTHDDCHRVEFKPGRRLQKFATTLSAYGPEWQDVALYTSDTGCVLLSAVEWATLTGLGVLVEGEPRYALHADGVGFIRGFVASSRLEARVRLSDRIANGEAFPGERVVELPALCDAQEHDTDLDGLTCPVCHPSRDYSTDQPKPRY